MIIVKQFGIIFLCSLIWGVQISNAQNLSVQQPVISNFGLNTTVVVPDRGAAYLGSVGRSAFTRSDFGPLNFSRPIGKTTSHSGASTSVWIHDFEAMDRALLQQADQGNRFRAASVSGGAITSRKPIYRVLGMNRQKNSFSVIPKSEETVRSKKSTNATLSLEELESALKSRR